MSIRKNQTPEKGSKDKLMQEALDIIIAKQDEDGRWVLEQTFNGRMQAQIKKVNHANGSP